MKLNFKIIFIILLFLSINSCSRKQEFRQQYNDANSLLSRTSGLKQIPFLKAHLKNGEVWIFDENWKIDSATNIVLGKGTIYDFNRYIVSSSIPLKLSLDSVALFETNILSTKGSENRKSALTLLTIANLSLTAFCILNPKSCFGSCPTFYINEDDNLHYSNAEGFSSAILPSLEYGDIDALNNKKVNSDIFTLTMKNEALETHCIKDVKLYAYPRNEGERIFQTRKNDFYLCDEIYPLTDAKSKEGDITSLLHFDDMKERFSLSDPNNLSSKEEIILKFDNIKVNSDLGLIVNFRQTQLTTYLFYSMMGYMGNEYVDIFTMLDQDKEFMKISRGVTKELGDIEVYLWNESKDNWEFKSSFYETGPIAINKQFLPLDYRTKSKNTKIKLVLNKGLWRLDYVALANIKEKVEPIIIPVSEIKNRNIDDKQALAQLNSKSEYLITYPGDEYKLNFQLPDENQDYELFLYSKGYYLEWMRDEWLKDKDMDKLVTIVKNPKKYLEQEAKNFKKYETTMEEVFWNSRIDTKTFIHNGK